MEPKYIRLAEELKKEIGERAPESWRLPSERELAEERGVSRQTVRQAMALLGEEGLIEKRQGSGNYANPKNPVGKRIAVITPGREDYLLSLLCRDVQNACAKENCTVQFFSTGNQISREREILQSFLVHPVDGICAEGTLSALPNPNLDLYRRLSGTGTSLIFMNGVYRGMEEAVSVSMDDEAGGYQAVRFLAEQDHRRIGFLFAGDCLSGPERYLGCLTAARDYELPMTDSCYLWYDSRQYEQFRKPEGSDFLKIAAELFLSSCTAVICQNDELSFLLIRAVQSLGGSVPSDLSVLCFEESYYREGGNVPMTSLACREGTSVGYVAARKLLRMTEKKREGSEQLPWVLKERASVRRMEQ